MDTRTLEPTTQPAAQGTRHGSASWSAFAAWGAGLIQIALGAGAITGEGGGPAARAAGFLLITLGVAALAWGAATLARGRTVVPRASIAIALAGIIVAFVTMAMEPARTSIFAVAAATVLLVAVALGCALSVRRGRRTDSNTDAASPTNAEGSRVLAIVVGAILIAGLVTPALAATEAGQLAPDHGDHGTMQMPGHH